jgi:hypothetical protein
MSKRDSIPVIHYTADRIPDDRPGGPATGDQFDALWEALVETCGRHGAAERDADVDFGDLDYWVVDDQYNDERYQYIEVCKPRGMTLAWLRDVMATLKRYPHWGAGIVGLGEGYMLVFADRLMVTGPRFEGATTFDGVVACARRALELGELVREARDDAGLERLTHVPELVTARMELRNLAQVTDAGLQFIARLRGLSSLDLSDSRVTDRGLFQLRSMTALKDLWLANTRVTGEGLVHLAALPVLKELSVRGCSLTKEGFRSLEKLVSLELLDLSGTNTTVDDLEHLERLTQLKSLHLARTKVSRRASGRLKRTLPGCSVKWD